MDGAPWIHDILAILHHFAIWARSKTCQENIVLIFFRSQCKLQGKINAQIYFGHNFWLEGHTDLRLTPLSYIFHGPFQGYPTWPRLSRAARYLANLAIWMRAIKVAKWGIPGKSMKNVAQRRWPEVRMTLQSKVMAKIDFCVYFPLYFTLWAKKYKNYVFLTSFGPGPNGKMIQNGKNIMNPRDSVHVE